MGGDNKFLLMVLGMAGANSKLAVGDAIHPSTIDTVVEVWQRFNALYAVVNHDYHDQNGVTSANIFGLANDWVKLFISLEGKRKGYEKKRVTPTCPALCIICHFYLACTLD